MSKRIHVAVGVVLNEHQQILIALRPEHTHQGGLWEFPGGKLEADETVQAALVRELKEELAIEPTAFRPLLNIEYDYTEKTVLLDVWWVDQFAGEARGCEGQPIRWVNAAALSDYAFPEANAPILAAIQRVL